jgi:hypothetical protein
MRTRLWPLVTLSPESDLHWLEELGLNLIARWHPGAGRWAPAL